MKVGVVANQDQESCEIDHSLIVDRIYEVALEPSLFEDFIDFWHDTDLAAQISIAEYGKPGNFEKSYQRHLERAQTFLNRGELALPNLSEYLRPYENLAAFIVSGSLCIEAKNSGAFSAFGILEGNSMDQLDMDSDIRAALIDTTKDILGKAENSEKLLKAEMENKHGAMLFRVVRIPNALEDLPAALIVTTQFYWRDSIGDLLGSSFNLTTAEQAVVRLLVEGHSAKAISSLRCTSESTVRVQIKSIIAKMNLRSQTDVIRLAMTLGKFHPKSNLDLTGEKLTAPQLSANWLEKEAWKPFESIIVPDGRTLTYHEMGPKNGNPILFSHMGSGMVRWSTSMIRLLFVHNLHVICPIRAGYGQSDNLTLNADIFETTSDDAIFLLNSLGISKLPYAVLGSDFPLGVDLAAKHPSVISELIGIGGRPCLPGGQSIDGSGRWQQFFASTARHAPQMAEFASKALMSMCKRIGPSAMLYKLCKDSPADLALLKNEEMCQILEANIGLMAGDTSNAARAFAMEFIAFHQDWSGRMETIRDIPVKIIIAHEDPTIDLSLIPKIEAAYPWIDVEIVPEAGLALVYQKPEKIISLMSESARRTARGVITKSPN